MAGKNDTHDFRKRKRRPKPGDIVALRRILWQALCEVETLLTEDDTDTKLRSASALATLGGVYLRAVELSELERRVAALEAAHVAKEPQFRSVA